MEETTVELPTGQSKTQANTPDSINQEIERQIEANVGYFKRKTTRPLKNGSTAWIVNGMRGVQYLA